MLTGLRRASAGLCLAFAQMTAAEAANMDGVWSRDDGNARVRIAPCGDKTCATSIWIRDTSKGEAPGDKLIMSLKRSSDTEFWRRIRSQAGNYIFSRRYGWKPDDEDGKGAVARLLCKTLGWAQVNKLTVFASRLVFQAFRL